MFTVAYKYVHVKTKYNFAWNNHVNALFKAANVLLAFLREKPVNQQPVKTDYQVQSLSASQTCRGYFDVQAVCKQKKLFCFI